MPIMTSIDSPIHWGNRLRQLLQQQRNLKQLALANAIGVEESTISRWLAGGNIKMSHLITLCNFLDVSLDWLIMGRGSPVRHKTGQEDDGLLDSLPVEIKQDIRNLVTKLTIQSDETQ